MMSKVASRRFTEVCDILASFVKKPDENEPGYKPDCWSMEHPEPKARGKPKDGVAAVVGFRGVVYISGAALGHTPQHFRMEGGTRSMAALGLAEWLGVGGHGGIIFLRSEAGSVRVLSARALVQKAEVWGLD